MPGRGSEMKELNMAIIMVDYYVQAREAGFRQQEAVEMSHKFMDRFSEEIKPEEVPIIRGLIDRLGKL